MGRPDISFRYSNQISINILGIISNTVAKHYGISVAHMFKKTNLRKIVEPRQMCHHLAYNLTKCSLSTIGTNMGNKDHVTVLYSNRTMKNLLVTDKRINSTFTKLKRDCFDLIKEYKNEKPNNNRLDERKEILKKTTHFNIHHKIMLNNLITI